MKKFVLHMFLCGAMAVAGVAPSIGWSDTTDELWTGQHNKNTAELSVFDRFNNKVLPANQLLKFIIALPHGVEHANNAMNDHSQGVVVSNYDDVHHKPHAGVFKLSTLQLMLGGGLAFLMMEEKQNKWVSKRLVRLDRKIGTSLSRDLPGRAMARTFRNLSAMLLLTGGALALYFVPHTMIHHELYGKSIIPKEERAILLSSDLDVVKNCHIMAGLKAQEVGHYQYNFQIQYKISECLDTEKVSYTGAVHINAAGAPIQVHAEQGVFEYNPEAKVFELTSN